MILSGLIHMTVSCILLDIGFTLENVKRQHFSENRFKNVSNKSIVHDTISTRKVTKSDSEFNDVTRRIQLAQDGQNIVLHDKLAVNYPQIIRGGIVTLKEVTESVLDVIELSKHDTTTMAFKRDPFIDETPAMGAKKSSTAKDGITVTVNENEPTIKESTPRVDENDPTTEGSKAMLAANESTTEGFATTLDENEPTAEGSTATVDENETTIKESTTTVDKNVPTIEGSTATVDENEPPIKGSTKLDANESTTEGSIATLNENEPTLEGSIAALDANESTIEGSTTTVDENEPTIEVTTSTMNENESTIEGFTVRVDKNDPNTEGFIATATVDKNDPTTEGFTATVDKNDPTTEGFTATADKNYPTTEGFTATENKNDPTTKEYTATMDENEPTTDAILTVIDEEEATKAVIHEKASTKDKTKPAKEVVEEQEDNDVLPELIKNKINITTSDQGALNSSPAPSMPEYIHTDELTTISQDRSIVVNQKPPKISILKANFFQSEKFDFSKNSKTLMPKSVFETIDIPAVITPSSTTVLPSTTTVPETQQQSSNKKIYNKCCQERQVVHLERGGVPYCERLHGVELPLLQPPSHSEVSGWGAGLMSIPVCINSSLSVLQEIMSLLLNLIKYRDSVNVISIESLL
ncbi:filamentous growth regulator 23 isoform X2 [Eurytemora carolleeae]|uniref:filamentous growth regulator 23 isoform X2 n=1 Tax=Eurytemora carolleeae TaxID=1294199 RepID=UPI000C78F058|nr:filamentous growth regulator 23 isoform X2 [Eurytemora carolleeae]|eukprot:XP_023334578.1 filamentous growth regulator 23-like isoform X2 [Eurytemora affinis]